MRSRIAATAAFAFLLGATAALAADPHAERVRLNAADVARAKRAVVHAADLSGAWTGGPVRSSTGTSRCAGFDPDFSAFTITGRADSAFSRSGGSGVYAHAELYPSHAQARADFLLGAKPAIAHCLGVTFVAGMRSSVGPGVKVKLVSSRFGVRSGVGERAVAVKVVATASAARTVKVYADVLAFQRGRYIGLLMFTGMGTHMSGQDRIVRLMLARMR
jgi:hypothetical protein